ncbi:MAG: SDR family NAD(P)-dependent oxidoreductase [Chloroflexota bacterium]
MTQLQGAVALVTGGAGGIGGSISQALVAAGARVVVADLWPPPTELIESAQGRLMAMQVDVSTAEGAGGMVSMVLAEMGRLDILVNCAGINQWVPFHDLGAMTEELWSRILATNLTGPFLCMKAAGEVMRSQGYGRIVNIGSIAGLHPSGSSMAYAVAKAGLIHLTRCMAVALAPEVLVNCVCPGLVEGTGMSARLSPEFAEKARKQSLLGHSVRKEDVAEQVLAFVRGDSATGQVVAVDAGQLLR